MASPVVLDANRFLAATAGADPRFTLISVGARCMMPFSLAGRSALITGANQGLGLAIARAYVQAGASVMLCARDEVLLAQARDEVAALARPDQRVLAMRADVSDRPTSRRWCRDHRAARTPSRSW